MKIDVAIAQQQLKNAPDYIQSNRFYNYPFQAVEEVLSNAVYHRGYDYNNPVEVQAFPGDSIQVLSYPAPMPPIDDHMLEQKSVEVSDQISDQVKIILKYCLKPQKRKDILEKVLNLTNHTKNFNNYIKPLVQFQWLKYTSPDVVKSSKQAYVTTDKGKLLLKILSESNE